MKLWCNVLVVMCLFLCLVEVDPLLSNMFDLRYWRCVLKKSFSCPDNDVRFYLYTPESGRKRMRIDIRNHLSLPLSGFDPLRKNVILIHGFNGTESKSPMTVLRDAYLYRGDTNIFTVDWAEISRFPCYLSSLSNTRLVAQCTAKLYAFMMDHGGIAEETSCVGHSLGAHICGMVSNHLDVKQHTIVGLDPARPLVDRFGDSYFRLTRDDAHHVQVIHTNAGLLGEKNQIGHVDFCVNGGMVQPGCKGNVVHIARCSHFQSACYFAKTVKQPKSIMGMPCSGMCPKKWTNWGFAPGKPVPMGHDTPYGLQGTYCVETDTKKDCPFN